MTKRKLRTEYDKLPKRVRYIIDDCRRGLTLCKSIRASSEGSPIIEWFMEPGGRRVTALSGERASRTKFLVANGDSQTWRAAPVDGRLSPTPHCETADAPFQLPADA